LPERVSKKIRDTFAQSSVLYHSDPFSPQGFCQHCEGVEGAHLGKWISYADLNDDCAKVVRQELAAYNEGS